MIIIYWGELGMRSTINHSQFNVNDYLRVLLYSHFNPFSDMLATINFISTISQTSYLTYNKLLCQIYKCIIYKCIIHLWQIGRENYFSYLSSQIKYCSKYNWDLWLIIVWKNWFLMMVLDQTQKANILLFLFLFIFVTLFCIHRIKYIKI